LLKNQNLNTIYRPHTFLSPDPRVSSPPRLITQSGSVEVPADQPLLLPCVAHSNPPPSYRYVRQGTETSRSQDNWKRQRLFM